MSDQTGAIIPGATVTITSMETGQAQQTEADAEGRYQSLPLRIGTYRVEAETAGFKRAVRDGIVLRIQENVVVDFAMSVGEVTEQVEITAEAPQLETTKATQGQVIDNNKIVNLPLNGRSYIELALLSAGANPQPPGARSSGFSGSGMRASQNNFLLDGVDNNNNQATMDARQAETVRPSVDAIQEFKLETNTFSAEYGRALGAVVNVTMKSGTNEIHGTAFEFLRNERLDAKNFFDNPTAKKPPFKRNQFGFSAGGPIIKNKTFIFGDFEGSRIRESRTVNNTIATQKMVNGDFTEISGAIYDPYSLDPETGARTPFPGNIIPESSMDAVGGVVAKWYPAPNKPGLKQNYLYNPPSNDSTDKWDVKVDHNFGPKDNIYGRYSWSRRKDPMSSNLPAPALGGNSQEFQHDGRNFVLAHNHVFSPTLLTSTRIGWNQIYTDRQSGIDHNYNAQLGLTGVNTQDRGGALFSISGFTNLGAGAYNPDPADSQNRQIVNDTTWIKGKHTLKFGANLSWLQAYNHNAQQASGVFYFDGSYTRDPIKRKGGHAIADLLTGPAYRAKVSNFVHFNWRAPYHAFYVQDEWRVIPKLTLNIGLRYEIRLPWVEKDNRLANFDLDTNPDVPTHVIATDGDRYSRSTIRNDMNNLGPRFGFAYELNNKTVVRGGYGIYYTTVEGFGDGISLSGNPPLFLRADISTDKTNPTLPIEDGLPPVTPENASNLTFTSGDRGGPLPYAQQWSFSIQRQLPSNTLFEIGYYANTAHRMLRRRQMNWADPGPGNINSRRRFKEITMPDTGVVISPLSAVYRLEPSTNSNFNSLQVRAEKRFSHGLTFLTTYIWSKTISDGRGQSAAGGTSNINQQDPKNLAAERSLADENRAHRFVTSFNYDLPFGRGRAYLTNSHAVVDGILGGWSIGGIASVSTGRMVSLSVKGNPSNSGNPDRPNVVGEWRLDKSARTLDRWFNTDAFVKNDPYTYGNAGRNLITGPGSVNFDFAVHKQFNLTERFHLQFRAEAFNMTNTPHFGVPNAQLGNGNYGSIGSAGRPRNLQFGLKVLF